MGTGLSGFQVQANAETVQSITEEALRVLLKARVGLTGSSRTDAGVHALQNFFHFDWQEELPGTFLYNLNAILPGSIAALSLRQVREDAHCRFHASGREYVYRLYMRKDPFLAGRAWFYPFRLDHEMLRMAARVVAEYRDFSSFSKRNTQVKTFDCRILHSGWEFEEGGMAYRVRANRFLRGMVRGLVGTMLLAGRGKLDEAGFRAVIEARDCTRADFTTPAQGLYLVRVDYPEDVWIKSADSKEQ